MTGWLSNIVDDAVTATAKVVVAPFKVVEEVGEEWDDFWNSETWDD